MKSQWKKRPIMARKARKANITEGGLEKVDSKPHDLLLASPVIPTLQEQVEQMNRIGAIRRTSILDSLHEDDYGEHLEDDLSSPEGITPYELEGQKDFWDDQSIKSKHETPDPTPPPCRARSASDSGAEGGGQ